MSSGSSTPTSTPVRTPPAVESPAAVPTPARVSTPSSRSNDGELAVFRQQWRNEAIEMRLHPIGSTMERRSALEALATHHSGPPNNGIEDLPTVAEDDEARPYSLSRTRHLLDLAENQRRAMKATEGSVTEPVSSSSSRCGMRHHFHHDTPANGVLGTKTQIKAAVKAYAIAVENERRGNLDESLLFYRKAFRLDSSADRLYERAASLLHESDREQSSLLDQPQVPAERQKDAVLASTEVSDMVRRATDIVDDVRIEFTEKTKAQAAHIARPPDISRDQRSDHAVAIKIGEALPLLEDDLLDHIVRRAKENNIVEGRNLDAISFISPPSAFSKKSQRNLAAHETSKVENATGELDKIQLTEDPDGDTAADDQPPPLIARLPNEVLTHICRCVIEPKGQRGARVRPPPTDIPNGGASSELRNGKVLMATEAAKPRSTIARGESAKSADANASFATRATQGVGILLSGPDWQSLETLARVSWKWRLVSRRAGLWKFICQETYQDPQLALPATFELVHPRLTFIHHPRLRLTGCYIAACHYSRPGLSVDNAWVRVTHLVEFYRSIRFLPDGRALTLLTTDLPKETVSKMHAANRDQGFAVGRWRVELPSSHDENKQIAQGKHGFLDSDVDTESTSLRSCRGAASARVVIEDLRDRMRPKYAFRMILSLRCTSRGKWNKMELLDHQSVHLETGEVCSIPSKHRRPFHFSTVRSYGV